MPEIVETVVYRVDELESQGRARAREWYRVQALDPDWHEAVFDDFTAICELLGVALATDAVPLMGGGHRRKPRIHFSGFCSQGDGACFEGRYAYRRAAVAEVRRHAPEDAELHRIADALQAVQRKNFFQLRAEVGHHGRYLHELTMEITVELDSSSGQDVMAEDRATVTEALRDLARWLYRQLRREYEYLTSDNFVTDRQEIKLIAKNPLNGLSHEDTWVDFADASGPTKKEMQHFIDNWDVIV